MNNTQEETLGYYHTEVTHNIYKFFLDEDIGHPSKYRELVNILNVSSEDDRIELYINTGGGDASSAEMIIAAIENTRATVVAIIVGMCYSAGGIIALKCHEVVVTKYAKFLAHPSSGGVYGESNKVQQMVGFNSKWIEKLYREVYEGFLTSEEIDDVLAGKDLWMFAEEIQERLEKRNSYYQLEQRKCEIENEEDDLPC